MIREPNSVAHNRSVVVTMGRIIATNSPCPALLKLVSVGGYQNLPRLDSFYFIKALFACPLQTLVVFEPPPKEIEESQHCTWIYATVANANR